MLAVGEATTSFASSPAAGMRVSVDASDGRRFLRPVPQQVGSRLLPDAGRHCRALPRPPGAPPSFFRALREAPAPRFRKRLDPRMGSKGAHEVTDMVTDCFAAQVQ
jgi:hypothetical protein